MEVKSCSRLRLIREHIESAIPRTRLRDRQVKSAEDHDQLTPFQRLSTRSVTLLIGISVTLLYLATLTSDYYWDGITFALQIEKVAKGESGVGLLFHQNHLLYNSVGYLLYRALHEAGIAVRAVNLLQIINAFVGGLAVAVFFRIAERATRNRYVAVVCSAALAVSAAWWKISTDADAYILTSLLVLIAAANLLGEKPRWLVAGAALAGAMLIHEMASLFFPAALLAVYSNRKIGHRFRFAAAMSALAWTVTISGYYLCAALLHDVTAPLDVLKWVTSNPSGKHLSSSPIGGLLISPKINIDAIIGHSFALFRRQGGWAELAVVLCALIAGLIFVVRVLRNVDVARALRTLRQWTPATSKARRQVAPVLIAWIATYALFLLFWGPLIYFRASYTPAIALAVGLVLANYHRVTGAKPSGAAAIAVAALGLFNLGLYIGPNMRSDANVLVAAAERADSQWVDNTVIFFADRNEADTAFEYFNEGSRWKRLNRASVLTLPDEVARIHREGGEVWLNRGAIEIVGQDRLEDYEIRDEITVEAPNDPARYIQVEPFQ